MQELVNAQEPQPYAAYDTLLIPFGISRSSQSTVEVVEISTIGKVVRNSEFLFELCYFNLFETGLSILSPFSEIVSILFENIQAQLSKFELQKGLTEKCCH